MANTNIGISNFINSQAPFFARNDHPNFIRFVESYYEYMEQEGKTIERAKGFRDALDVDKSIDLYTEQLYSQFMSMIPTDIIADKNLIIKHIKDFYRARGTEKSIEFLMSILYDEDVTFYYPKRDILKASDGKWYQEKSLKIYDILVNNVADPSIFTAKNFTGRQIRGETSNATATVESVDVYYETGVIVKELKISNQVRDFKAGEMIRAKYEEEGLIKDIAANVFSGIIVRADIINRGNNYSVGQRANVISNTGSGAILSISEVSAAAIKSISPVDGGAGFQNGNSILISSSGGFGANANVSLINADEAYHPNTYNIGITLIGTVANSVLGTISSNAYETFAYANLNYVLVKLPGNTSNLTANSDPGVSINTLKFNLPWIANSNVFMKTGDSINAYNSQTATSYVLKITASSNVSNQITFTPLMPGSVGLNRIVIIPEPFNAKSNLTISCGIGAAVTTINLSAWKANSNVFFETFDNVYIANVTAGYYANATIISSNSKTNQLIVNPGLPGPLTNQEFFVLKRPNAATTLANSLGFFTYANTGPIQRVLVLAGGQGYTGAVSLTAQANTRITNLGIIGRLAIVRPGYGYAVNDEIEIINKQWATFSAGTGGRAYVSSVNAYGSITGVKLKAVPGFPVGGTGYSEEDLPTTNVITSTGVGGNVAVTGLLGGGEILTSTSDDIGAILKIDIISGGTGYATAPVIDLTNYGSGTAQVNVTIVQGVYTYPGRYLNDDGHLSSFNFLQDGKYYHNYSYVTRIRKSIENYRDALKKLVHPAGMSLFGEHISVDDGETMNVQVIAANQTAKYLYIDNIKYRMSDFLSNITTSFVVDTNTRSQNVGSQVYIEFASGNATTMNANGYYYVKSILNANSMVVYSGIKLPATMNVIANTGETGIHQPFFREDGKILFTIGTTRTRVLEYDLDYPWDITSARFRTTSPLLSSQDTVPVDVYIKPDGNTFYMLGQTNKTVRQYSINIGNTWNVNTATFVGSYNVSAFDATPTTLTFSNNGTRMYVGGSANDRIHMFNLATPWVVNTAIYMANVSVSSNDATVASTYFKYDGRQLYFVGDSSDRIHQYTLTEAWNIQTAVYNTRTAAVTGFEPQPLGLAISNTGNVAYLLGRAGTGRMYQFPLTEAWNVATIILDTLSTSGNSGNLMIAKQVT